MAYSRLQFETALLAITDATASTRWSAVEYRNAATIALRREWRSILKSYPTYRYATRTVTTDASGQFAVASLTSGSGDTAQRFLQIVGPYLWNGTTRYEHQQPQDVSFALSQPASANGTRIWWRQGSVIQVLPVESGLSLSVPVNHIPAAFKDLSGDGIAVEFPEDYELLPIYMTAALLFSKGDTETGGTGDFARIAEDLRSDMLAEIGQQHSGPNVIRASDCPTDWAG